MQRPTISAPHDPGHRRVGEITAATSTSLTVQCYQLYDAPPLGSLVQVGAPPVYGVVCRVCTEPLDAGRPVLARGEEAASEEEVFQNHPQLSRLLTSRFEALIVGYRDQEECRQYLPPVPPRVHSFVYTCCRDTVAQFTSRLDFLHLLAHSGVPAADEVIGACLREAAMAHPDRRAFLLRAGQALAAEMAADLPRLNAILRSVTT